MTTKVKGDELYQIGIPIERVSMAVVLWDSCPPKQTLVIHPSRQSDDRVVIETRSSQLVEMIRQEIMGYQLHISNMKERVIKI